MDIQLPLPKGEQQPPLFGPCLLWPNGRPSQLSYHAEHLLQTTNGRPTNLCALYDKSSDSDQIALAVITYIFKWLQVPPFKHTYKF